MTDYYKPSVQTRVALPFMTLLCALLLLVACDGALKTKITVKVVDEEGNPIDKAKVSIGYYLNDPPQNGHGEEGFTNTKGELTSTGKSHGYVSFIVSKPGYYNSSGSYQYPKRSGFSWEPTNPKAELVLRKIMNPVPMYARDLRWANVEIPVIGDDVGFDLMKSDWVAPFGDGETSDFIINVSRDYADKVNYKGALKLTFENKHDGIQQLKLFYKESEYKTEYTAPRSGYKNKYISKIENNNKSYKSTVEKNKNLVFRVRSEEYNGNQIRSMYGKVHGDIGFSFMSTKTAYLTFRYYLNPSYENNIEFDVGRNLFVNPNQAEKVKTY